MIKLKKGDSKIHYELGGTSNLSDSKEDLVQFRVGAEYLAITDFAVIPLRAGYKTAGARSDPF